MPRYIEFTESIKWTGYSPMTPDEPTERKPWIKPQLIKIDKNDAKAEWLCMVHDLVLEYEGMKAKTEPAQIQPAQ